MIYSFIMSSEDIGTMNSNKNPKPIITEDKLISWIRYPIPTIFPYMKSRCNMDSTDNKVARVGR